MSPPTTSPAQPVEETARVLRLKRGEERRLLAGHLWVFSNEIDTDRTPLGAFAPGEIVQLRSYRDAFLGYAYLNPHALICARILSRDAAHHVTAELIEQRLTAALALRATAAGCSASRISCRGWCSIVTASSSSGRSPRPGWRRCASRSRRRYGA